MINLMDIYTNIKNPIENTELLNRIIEAYSKTSRTNLLGCDLYEELVTMNQTKDDSEINISDREKFMIETYNQWIHNILKLDSRHSQNLEKNLLVQGI